MDDQQVSETKQFWTEDKIADELRRKAKELGRKPRAHEMPAGFVKRAQQRFGSWNKALTHAFGAVTQARYGEISNDDLLRVIRTFVQTYKRLPQRQEFNGKEFPFWEVYTKRFSVRQWTEVLGLVDLSDLTYYANKHGYGKIFKYRGITYLSREEYLIGKYLTDQDIAFVKEVPYENASFVFDFYLPSYNVYIEYYGIATPEYKETIARKQSAYAGRNVIEIFKHDNTIKTLVSKLHRL